MTFDAPHAPNRSSRLAKSLPSSDSASSCGSGSSLASSPSSTPRANETSRAAPWWQTYADSWRSAQALAKVTSADAALMSMGLPGLHVAAMGECPATSLLKAKPVSQRAKLLSGRPAQQAIDNIRAESNRALLAARARRALRAGRDISHMSNSSAVLAESPTEVDLGIRHQLTTDQQMASRRSRDRSLRGSSSCSSLHPGAHSCVGVIRDVDPAESFDISSSFASQTRRLQAPAVHRSLSDVKQVLRRVCANLGYPRADAENWASEMETECLVDLKQLKTLNDDGWARLGLPLGIEHEFRRVLGVPMQAHRQVQSRGQQPQPQQLRQSRGWQADLLRQRPGSAPPGQRYESRMSAPPTRTYSQQHQRKEFFNYKPWRRG